MEKTINFWKKINIAESFKYFLLYRTTGEGNDRRVQVYAMSECRGTAPRILHLRTKLTQV